MLLMAICWLPLALSGQSSKNANGVILKGGITSSLFLPNQGRLIHNAATGYTFGFDGLFNDGNVIIQPGVHFMLVPKTYSALKSAFNKPANKPANNREKEYHQMFKIPARLGLYLLNTGNLRLNIGAGLFGLYSPKGVTIIQPDYSKNFYRVAGGWNIHAGLLINPLMIEIEYDATFGTSSTKGPMYFRCISLTGGIFF